MIYTMEYYENLLRRYSTTAGQINRLRWRFVKEVQAVHVLDYGCGVGWFRAFRPPGVEVDTYDVMPVAQTGILRDSYDLITFWDVLEHMSEAQLMDMREVFGMAKWAATTIPIWHMRGEIEDWRHYKPGEHLTHWSRARWMEFMNVYGGYRLIKDGCPECPPRADVWSALWRRK